MTQISYKILELKGEILKVHRVYSLYSRWPGTGIASQTVLSFLNCTASSSQMLPHGS